MARKGMKVGMQLSHPGTLIKTEVIEELVLSISKAADILGVRRATLCDLVHGKTALSPEMALRLAKAFQLNMEMLLGMQARYDSAEMRKQAKKIKVSPHVSA